MMKNPKPQLAIDPSLVLFLIVIIAVGFTVLAQKFVPA